MVPAEAVEEVTIIGVADEVSQDRGLEMQVRAEVDSEVKEVAQVAEQDDEITAKAQVPKSLVGSPIISAPEVGGSSTPSLINNPLAFFL